MKKCSSVPLSATRLASLAEERTSKDEKTNLEISDRSRISNLEISDSSDKEEDYLINIQPARCEFSMAADFKQDKPCSRTLKLLKSQKQKLKEPEKDVGEIVKSRERMTLLHCESDARMPFSLSENYEGPSQTRKPLSSDYEGPRMTRSRSTSSKTHERNCNEKPGRFEMLI